MQRRRWKEWSILMVSCCWLLSVLGTMAGDPWPLPVLSSNLLPSSPWCFYQGSGWLHRICWDTRNSILLLRHLFHRKWSDNRDNHPEHCSRIQLVAAFASSDLNLAIAQYSQGDHWPLGPVTGAIRGSASRAVMGTIVGSANPYCDE